MYERWTMYVYLLRAMDHFLWPAFGAREEQCVRVRVYRIGALGLRRKSKACSDKRIDIDIDTSDTAEETSDTSTSSVART
jgi:hypothetical protein